MIGRSANGHIIGPMSPKIHSQDVTEGPAKAAARAMLRAALDGQLADAENAVHPQFGLRVPQACPDVPAEVLDPRSTWQDPKAYDATATDLTRRFEANFKQFEDYVGEDVKAAGIYSKAA